MSLPTNDKNFKLLNGWLLSLNLSEKKEPKLEDIHINELIGKKDNKTSFFESLNLFYDLIHLNFEYNFYKDYVPSLVFRLKFSNNILFNVNENIWEEFEASPPNIYLIPKTNFLAIEEIEEYKKPLNLNVFKKFKSTCAIYYSCYRMLEDIRHNWEYARVVSIRNFVPCAKSKRVS